MSFFDFNTAEARGEFALIPDGTVAPFHLKIRPGGFNSPEFGNEGLATKSMSSNAIYLNCEYTCIEGDYINRKVFGLIGLYSPNKDNAFGNSGRSMIRSLILSSRGFELEDQSPQAQQALVLSGFSQLDGIEFLAKVSQRTDKPTRDYPNPEPRNQINLALTSDTDAWKAYYNNGGTWRPSVNVHAPPTGAFAGQPTTSPQQQAANDGRPAWMNR